MKLKAEKGYVSIVSPSLTCCFGLWSGSPRKARAVAFFPFIIFRSEKEKIPWIIQHERIHLRQQFETAFIGIFLWSFLETLYAIVVLRKNLKEAYLWRSSEQEAYRNHHTIHYLEHRPWWAVCKYAKDKKEFTVGQAGEILYIGQKSQ